MQEHRQAIRLQVLVLACSLALGAVQGAWGVASALAAGLAILLPELMCHVLAARILVQREVRGRLGRALRLRMFKLVATVLFVAAGISALGGNIAVLVWLATLVAMALAPAALLLPGLTGPGGRR